MAADLNDELLALAGDGSDEEEEYEEVEEEEQSEDEGAVQEQSSSMSPPRPSIEKPTSTSPSAKTGPAMPAKTTQKTLDEEGYVIIFNMRLYALESTTLALAALY